MAKSFKELKREYKPKARKFGNILLGLVFFVVLVGAAFKLSFLFGAAFVVAFALAIYSGELKHKPWKPIAVFIGALLVRIALEEYFQPVLKAQTIMDLAVSALVFAGILFFGWKIKKS